MNSRCLAFLGCLLILSSCASPFGNLELNGTRWILQANHDRELLEDIAITLKVTEQELSGSSGCNLYFAKYTLKPVNGIQINELANTEMACNEPVGVMEQEVEYLNTFRSVTSYRYEEEKLFLLNDLGDTLLEYRLLPKFNANPQDLIGKTWRLKYADNMEDYEVGSFTLRFDGSTFRGTTSCRDYEGAYQFVDDTIRVSMMEMTSGVACSHLESHSEGTYTTLLGWIDQYNILGNQLELYTVQNDKLIYESEAGE